MQRTHHIYEILILVPKFVIQSDFITLVNRETVVRCPWNDALRQHVAETFAIAIRQLTIDNIFSNLFYDWLEYLPKPPIDGFWSDLSKDIVNCIKELQIMKAWKEFAYAPASRLVLLPDHYLHEDQPLFDDTVSPSIYLSPEYTKRGFKAQLRTMGIPELSWSQMLKRMENDLEKETSKLKRTPLDDAWQLSFAEFIEEVSRSSVHVYAPYLSHS